MVDLSQVFFDFLTILSALTLLISLYTQQIIPTPLLIFAFIIVPFALARGKFERFLIRTGVPILSLITLSIMLGKGENVTLIFSLLLQLSILIFALYIMFIPLRKN